MDMDIHERIRQFETMVRPEADPNNDMAWFSLGTAYAQAGRHAEAAGAFTRCYELNGDMSKAYQLAGKAWLDAGEVRKAAEVLTKGYAVAAARGDFMPKKAMGEMLEKMGRALPEVEGKGEGGGAPVGTFVCQRTGRPGTRMARPPFKGAIGQWIYENISKETFVGGWVPQGTKVINELRLDLSREEDEKVYDRHMREYLGIDDELYEKLTGRKPE
jgi:Fe-S cluster biosynthesis and repair protein YggX